MKRRKRALVISTCLAMAATANPGVVLADNTGDITEIVWQYPVQGEVKEGFYRVEEALNEMLEKDIGVHVTFEPVDLMESQNKATLMVSAGEQLDICLTAFAPVGSLVESGLIIPLDEILDTYGQDILEHTDNLIGGCRYDGQTYGVPTGNVNYVMYAYCMKKRFAEKYDCLPSDDKIYTLDELEEIFAKIKEGEGDECILHIPWTNTYEPLNYGMCEYDNFGSDTSWGVLMLNRDFQDTTIFNLYETEEYAEYCARMYDWAQKGYISPDAATVTDLGEVLFREKTTGWFDHGAPYTDMLELSYWGEDVVQYKTIAPFVKGGVTDIMWNITSSCENPEKAVETLNYLYKNKEAAWLLQYGFEGEEYEIVEKDGDNVLVKYLADDPSSLPYASNYGIWGDRLEWPVFVPQAIDTNQRKKETQDMIPDDRKSPAMGYSFKSESVSSEIAAVQTVIAQYAPSLNAGAVNPEDTLPEFIDALKAAGIDTVIAENQRQFDEFLAQN